MERGDDDCSQRTSGFHNTKLGSQRSEFGSQRRVQFGIPRVGEVYSDRARGEVTIKMARGEFGARDEVFSDTARDFGSEYEPRTGFMRRPLRSDIDVEAGDQLVRSNGARGGFNNGAGAGVGPRQRPNNIGAGGRGGGFDDEAGGQFGSERRSGSQRYISKLQAGNSSRFVEEEPPFTAEEELQLTRSVLAIMEEDAFAGNQQNADVSKFPTLTPSKRKTLESEFTPSYEISTSYVGPAGEYTERETKSNLGLYDRSIHTKKTKADVCEARVNTLNAQAAAAKAMAEAMVTQCALLKERNVLLLMTSRAYSPAGKEYIRLRQAEELEKYKELLAEEALREQEEMEAAANSDIGEEA